MERIESTLEGYWETILDKVPQLIEGALILIIFVLLANLVKRLAGKRLENKTDDKLRARFLTRVLTYSIIIIGLMMAMNAAGYSGVATGLLAGAGVSAFVIGFALKDIGENFLAGFLLSFSRPFRINDTIEVDGMTGKVKAVNLRNTHLKTFNGKDVFIPNATLIKQNLQNHTLDGYMRFDFTIGVAYDTEFNRAREIIEGILKNNENIAADHAPFSVDYESLGASTYNIKAMYWKDMFDPRISGASLKTQIIEDCLRALSQSGIAMPGDVLEVASLPEIKLSSKA